MQRPRSGGSNTSSTSSYSRNSDARSRRHSKSRQDPCKYMLTMSEVTVAQMITSCKCWGSSVCVVKVTWALEVVWKVTWYLLETVWKSHDLSSLSKPCIKLKLSMSNEHGKKVLAYIGCSTVSLKPRPHLKDLCKYMLTVSGVTVAQMITSCKCWGSSVCVVKSHEHWRWCESHMISAGDCGAIPKCFSKL